MIRLTELKLPLAHERADLQRLVLQTLGLPAAAVRDVQVFKRSVDARKAQLWVVYIVDVALADPLQQAQVLQRLQGNAHVAAAPDMTYRLPVEPAPAGGHVGADSGRTPPPDGGTHGATADEAPGTGNAGTTAQWADTAQDGALAPVIVGFGPCGIFAALLLAQMGFKPIVLERGRRVRERTRDTWALWRKSQLDPQSNVQFGEGGAGTFSDGKLWSQIKDPRFLGRKVMEEFVRAGAPPEILVDAHPHIGTFRLVKVVEHMREQILALGGEIRFGQQMVDLEYAEGALDAQGRSRQLRALCVRDLASGSVYRLPTRHAVLAPGHSARDTFVMLHARGVAIAAKPFSIGFRIEHPQGVIDRARWGRHAGHPALGAAEYRLVHHAGNGRSVYSFCMCPGGTVVAATSEVGRVVTNGMSQYSRNERNANAGIVVGIDPADFPREAARIRAALGPDAVVEGAAAGSHPLAGIVLQRELESNAFVLGGGSYHAPAQLVGDFLADRASSALGGVEPSYRPGVVLGNLTGALPDYAIAAIREALPVFGRRIRGFDMADAVLTGVETRTSSPVRIGRDADCQSTNLRGLYPAGEGAGFAGGILSAAVDGIRMAEAVALSLPG